MDSLRLIISLAVMLTLIPVAGCSDDATTPIIDPDTPTAGTFPVVDTGQSIFYDASAEIAEPTPGAAFHGQDAHYDGNQPSYTDNGDGTVTDNVTGLMWQQDPGAKTTVPLAEAAIGSFDLGGYTDWRIPTIKELYSLILFNGTDPSGLIGDDTSGLTPFIDPVFAFEYGDPDAGERIIDSQFLTSTMYVSTTMGGDETVFGVNFADGRIKGYPVVDPMSQSDKTFFALFVRGGSGYGVNDFTDNGDLTVTDAATGLMWMQQDSGHLGAGTAGDGGLTWEEALAWAEGLTYAGHDDWRLPNAKELQSILDYSRSPATSGTPAIDPVFLTSTITVEDGSSDFPFTWSGTTHANHVGGGSAAAYVAFGTGYGWMEAPPGSGNYNFWDVHGAGCQRSDPKTGDPADYPYGHGPQGDVIRITNHVRLVRDAAATTEATAAPDLRSELKAAPNPSNPITELSFTMAEAGAAVLEIFDVKGRRVRTVFDGMLDAGEQSLSWRGVDDGGGSLPSGVYLAKLATKTGVEVVKVGLAR